MKLNSVGSSKGPLNNNVLVRLVVMIFMAIFSSVSMAKDFSSLLQAGKASGQQPNLNSHQISLGPTPIEREYEMSLPIVLSMFNRVDNYYLDTRYVNVEAGAISKNRNVWNKGVALLGCAMECYSNPKCEAFNYAPKIQICRHYSRNRHTAALSKGPLDFKGQGVLKVQYFGKKEAEKKILDKIEQNKAQAQKIQEKECYDMVQGKVAWNQAGNKQWADKNIKDLCYKTVTKYRSASTINCFKAGIASHNDWKKAIASCAYK